jgi:cell division protease FtsH
MLTSTSSSTLDRDQLRSRQASLDAARDSLKNHFVGIDAVIDGLCDAIAVWYLMPEVLTRPPIVNLWGMTGVGKTDLVRRLVRLLDLSDRFVEFELSNSDITYAGSSVAQRLAETRAVHGEPTLLLFDEIQRFNTIDQDGRPVQRSRYSDFWELLSDGRLSRRERDDIDDQLARMLYGTPRRGADADDEGLPWWEAVQLYRRYGIGQSATAGVGMSYDEAASRLRTVRDSRKFLEPIDCSKCLVIISGNLDEAFTMASQAAETDIDADIFHAFTSKITMLDIKAALSRRFKPEQVARFGNVHLIYPSLRRRDFETLIDRDLRRLETSTQAFGIDLRIGPGVNRVVFRNGVFPVQGARPVFSTVAGLVESALAKVVFEARVAGCRTIRLDYDEAASGFVAVLDRRVRVRVPVTAAVDAVRRGTHPDQVANVAAHEAGHALAYALEFGLAPLQLTARVASGHVGGFTFPHDLQLTADSMLRQVRVQLAGGIAEELLFGGEHASTGREHDRKTATELTADYVRRYGFSVGFTAHYSLPEPHHLQRTRTDRTIEELVCRQEAAIRQRLQHHRGALVDLARELAAAGQLNALQVCEVLARHEVSTDVRPEGYRWMPGYAQMLEHADRVAEDRLGLAG